MPEDSKSLIKIVSGEIGGLFKRLWDYQHIRERFFGDFAQVEISGEEHTLMMETIRETNVSISKALNRLTPSTFPKEDPNVAQDMYDFLKEVSFSYAPKNKQRSAQPILRYLLTACGHTFWLWRQWINSCIVVGDYTSAAALLEEELEATEFSIEAKEHHAHWLCAKAVLLILRDEDKEGALELAETARKVHGSVPDTIALWKILKNNEELKPEALITGEWR